MKDVFDIVGTKIQKGHVIFLSKGTRGHRNFDSGIVVDFIPGKKFDQFAFIQTVYAHRVWDSKIGGLSDQYQLNHSRHLLYDTAIAIQKNIVVVSDYESKPFLDVELIKAVDILIEKGIFPEDYVIGRAIEETETIKPKVEKKKLEKEEEYFLNLGLPSNLKKEI